MFRNRRWPALLLILFGSCSLLLWRSNSSAVLYTGTSRIDSGPLALEVAVDPPVSRPGDVVRVKVRLSNAAPQAQNPSVVLFLPRSLDAGVFSLPAGATFNLQENRIDWLPDLPAGGTLDLVLGATVETADMLAPEQSVSVRLRHQGDEKEAVATTWIGIPPLLGDMMFQTQVAVGQPIRLRASLSGPEPLTTIWDLGDGRRLELAEPEVVFPAAGQYEITVDSFNPGGRVTGKSILTVVPQPVAAFQPDDDAPAAGQTISFVNQSGGQPPLNVYWDFGDGATLVGERSPSHTYDREGTFQVRLLVENDFGRSEAVMDVTVGGSPAGSVVLPDRTAVGQPLVGQALAGDAGSTIIWDMGDGRTNQGPNVSHFYRQPGDYYVRMTLDNGHGRTEIGQWVHVDPGVSSVFIPVAAQQPEGSAGQLSAALPADVDLSPAVASLDQPFVLDPIAFPPGTAPTDQLYAYLNATRARFSLPALPYSTELSLSAQSHARDKALFPDNPHIGTDGTTAAERLLRSGYRGGFAGEATAWGFADAKQAVEFWVNSDSHRPILLNQLGSEVGVGYHVDHASPNIWHWTADFGISYGSPAQAVVRLQSPVQGQTALDTDFINFGWMWPVPLAAGEHFTVYLMLAGEPVPLGQIDQPVYGSRYVLSADVRSAVGLPPSLASANREWLVRLETASGQVIAESDRRMLAVMPDLSTPFPTHTPAASIITATPVAPTFTPTPLPAEATPTLVIDQPPVIITATPQPSPAP